MTSEIFNQAAAIKDATDRKDYLDGVCAGNEALRKDLELLLKKAGLT
jgi:hypothetical protein